MLYTHLIKGNYCYEVTVLGIRFKVKNRSNLVSGFGLSINYYIYSE